MAVLILIAAIKFFEAVINIIQNKDIRLFLSLANENQCNDISHFTLPIYKVTYILWL